MMKILYVGDPHAVPSELADCWGLVNLIEEVRGRHPDALVCFLGDQHHTHGLVHLPVMEFWRRSFKRLGGSDGCLALIGNHDKEVWTGPESPENVMEAYRDVCRVVSPRLVLNGVTFVSHTPSNDDFLKLAGSGTTLVCHQSFDGCRYENGMPIRDGVDVGRVDFKQIISGHIHAPQTVGKVWYPGAPRWRTLADAKILERHIWLVTHADDGTVLDRVSFSTVGKCRPIRQVIDTPEEPLSQLEPGCDWRIEIRGPAAYVQQRRGELAGAGRKIKTFITDTVMPTLRESEGLEQAFQRYVESFSPTFGTSLDRLKQMARERLGAVL